MAHILIVEDSPDLAFGLQLNLEVEGYQVTTAATGSDALDLSTNDDVDLVLLDLILPDMPGFEVLRMIRGSQRTPSIIILSARGAEIDRVTAFRLGADDYMCKPFSVLELIERVRLRLASRPRATAVAVGLQVAVGSRRSRSMAHPCSLLPESSISSAR